MKIARNKSFIVMGVCGVGKTTVAQHLAEQISASFLDADDFHSDENVRAMREGRPLTDAMRFPWLHGVAAGINAVRQSQPDKPVVAACSALKRSYRDVLRDRVAGTVFIYLSANESEIRQRMAERNDHFMPVQMLEGQLAVLEPPSDDELHIQIDAMVNIDEILSQVMSEIKNSDAFA